MIKLWLLEIPILLSLFSCEAFHTGGNPSEGTYCRELSKKNAFSYMFFLELSCLYGKVCNATLSFLGSGSVDTTLDGRCFSGYELRLETADTSRTVLENKIYSISLTPDNHALFSLVDEDDIEKKYDIDLSEIVDSYTVHGDSVDVNVMKHCKISVFTKPHMTEIFGNLILNSVYSFSILSSNERWFSYKCSWNELGPLRKDDLEVYAELHWE